MEYYKELLEENRAKRELVLDGTLQKKQSKTFNKVGLLKELWLKSGEVLAQENNMYG